MNNEPLDDEVLREEIRSLRVRLAQAMPHESPSVVEARAKEWARENVIERMLLRQAALADVEPLPPEVIEKAAGNADTELQFRVERLAIRHAGRIAPPRNKDIVEYYRRNRGNMTIPESVRAAHILKKIDQTTSEEAALEATRAVEQRLQAGDAFETVADELSDDSPGNGGDLGWFPRGQMVPEFEAVVFALKPGEISPVFRTPFGFHIAKVYAHSEERLATFEEARPQIERHLLSEKHQKALERLCDHLRARAVIEEVTA